MDTGRPAIWTAIDLLEILAATRLSFADFLAAAESKGMSRATFKRYLRTLKETGKVVHVSGFYSKA